MITCDSISCSMQHMLPHANTPIIAHQAHAAGMRNTVASLGAVVIISVLAHTLSIM